MKYIMEVKNLSYSVNKKQILNDVTAQFTEGKITAIIGPNGSGKSTLMSFLSKTRKSANTVFFRGKDVNDISARDYSFQVSVLPQQQKINADFKVEDVVIMGRFPYKKQFCDYTKEDRRIAQDSMKRVGIENMATRRLSQMSGGEIQRVMIAKALAQEPELILMDEPTNHLDVKYKVALMETLRSYGKTVIVVLHDLSLAVQYCDDAVIMVDGQVFKQGNTRDIMQADMLESVFGVPFVKFEHNNRIYINY
ncbi:MAG: ABC transporter ATP-binding protein [Selenomonadaceae bacterium]|nr:ABC transporter ATP-binding protein [Selenomonadaceae bacterium]